MNQNKMYGHFMSCLRAVLLFLLACPYLVSAQSGLVIRGLVSENGNTASPLTGVSILEKGSSNATTTDDKGRFQIEVKDEKAVLIFSFIGMKSQEVAVGKQRDLRILLSASGEELEEVVVTGYGTQRKSDLTGSVAVVSSKELLNVPVNNALQALKGKVAGVNVFLNSGSPTGSPRVLIRGLGTIN